MKEKEYGVKVLEFDRWDRELYKEIEDRCNNLVGQKFYVKQAGAYIKVTRWFDQECDIMKGTKAIILVFVCDKEVEPDKVLKELEVWGK